MSLNKTSYWKQLWRWTSSEHLSPCEVISILGDKDIVNQLCEGLNSYKPQRKEQFEQLQNKYPDQTKLLNVIQTLQHYIDIDTFQIWDVLNHYLWDISYGTPSSTLKNVDFVDTRPSFLLPNIWKFYYAERLYLLKLLQYVLEHKDNLNHKYHEQFNQVYNSINVQTLKSSLLNQFSNIMNTTPPSRKILKDFSNDHMRSEWCEFNLREQLAVLQILLLIANETPFTDVEFKKVFELCKKHGFGKQQCFVELLEERHREHCIKIMYSEIALFMVIVDADKINNVSTWINSSKQVLDYELRKLQPCQEYSAMLMSWMLITLQSREHAILFESQYQQFGATAMKMHVFEFLHQLLTSSVYSNDSKASLVVRKRIFKLLNQLCDKFDCDGTLGRQPGAIELCSELLRTPEIADEFWKLHEEEDNFGTVSFWNTALEFFPYNFQALSVMAYGLAKAGESSVKNLIGELKCLPVYTEIYKTSIPIAKVSIECDDVVVGQSYSPAANPSYNVEAGSRAAVMERKEGTFIHFRTPYSYWSILNDEIEKALDRKGLHYDINTVLEHIWDGTKVLKEVLSVLSSEGELSKSLFLPSEGVFDVLLRFMRGETPPLSLLVSCLETCKALVPFFPKEIYLRLINTGLLPRVMNQHLSFKEYAEGASFDSAVVGSYLVNIEQPNGSYKFLVAYIDMICEFYKAAKDERITSEIVVPGLVLILREVFPNICGWRYSSTFERRQLIGKCIDFFFLILQQNKDSNKAKLLLQNTCAYGLLYTENALEILKIASIGNDQLDKLMYDETSWVSGSGVQYLTTIQQSLAVLMKVLSLKSHVSQLNEMSPLEQLVFAQNKQSDPLKVVPKITSYINHVFNGNLAMLSCRLLNRFAADFQMSLFTCLDMTPYHVRVMFLERLRDKFESTALKIAIMDFVATCVGKQPGLTQAFFKLRHIKQGTDENKAVEATDKVADDDAEGVLTYMAQYLSIVKSDAALLHSPLLGCTMALFHALWKNNMQILVKELRENPKFWEHMTSPLFNEIQPHLKAYSQIFNIIGIELFFAREQIEPSLKDILESFFDTNKQNLDKWIDFIFSFEGRNDEEETVDTVPTWLGLLTSWKDFTMIFCKCLPISLNIAHKAKMVAPCMSALLNELNDLKDGRLVVILSELYVTMLANWKDDCFDNRKVNAKQVDNLLTNTCTVYDSLHPRAKRALLSIGTVAISTLDYEIKANSSLAHSIIRSVTNINTLELEKLFDDIKDEPMADSSANSQEEIPPVVLSLAMLEQCLDLYDDMFSGLGQWFHSTRFVNRILCCLQTCLHNRRHYHTSLAALRCLTAYSRGPFSKDLLSNDIDQFLWLQLLPPKQEGNGMTWNPAEWWRVYAYSLDFISMMIMKHGQYFVRDAITFVGVHLEFLIESVLLPRQVVNMDSLNVCASTLNLVVQLVKYEARWRIENITSLFEIMRSISACLYQCVTLSLRSRRVSDPAPPPAAASLTPATPSQNVNLTPGHNLDDSFTTPAQNQHTPTVLTRILEIQHMATLCLLSFSPDLLSLLADPGIDLERWQPLVELHFGAPKISYEPFPQLTFGTLLAAIGMLTKSLNHAYHMEEGSGSRSPRSRRRVCSCGSPGEARRVARSESLTSISSATSAAVWSHANNQRLVAGALEATLTLLASQALLAVRDPSVPDRHKQLVRRELSSELTAFHDFVRKRILCAAHTRPHLVRNKLGAWPLLADDEEIKDDYRFGDDDSIPPPPPPKRTSNESMREYILRKRYLVKCAQTPTKDPPSPVSHSTPTSDKKKDTSRSSKKVSWADTTMDSDETADTSMQEIEPAYSNLTDVQINNDEDYFHFMSVVFLYVCQTEL